jgi:hypothetical protein
MQNRRAGGFLYFLDDKNTDPPKRSPTAIQNEPSCVSKKRELRSRLSVNASVGYRSLNLASCLDDKACVRKTNLLLPLIVSPQCGQMIAPGSCAEEAIAV